MAKRKPGLKVLLPAAPGFRPLLEVLREIASKHPGIPFGNYPHGPPQSIEQMIAEVERETAGDIPEEFKVLLTGPFYVWGYDDLGLVIVLSVSPIAEGMIPVMIESSEAGLPIDRPMMEGNGHSRRFSRRSLRLPLADALQDLARSHPGMVLSRPGLEDMTVEEFIKYVELAIVDPRLMPNAHARLTGHNFFWAIDEDGRVVVMVYNPEFHIIEGQPFLTEVSQPPSMGARRAEDWPLPSGEGPWSEILRPLGDRYSDFVKAILISRIRNSVVFLGMKGDEAVRWARCFAAATSPAAVAELLRQIVPEVVEQRFSSEVERMLREWHGSAALTARPGLLDSLQTRARSWYLFLSAASEIQEKCGWQAAYTHSKTPGVILMDAVHYAGDGLWAPEVN